MAPPGPYWDQARPKHRGPWQRSYSHPVNLQTPNLKTAVPISDVTRNKLNKFQYQSPSDEPDPDQNADGAKTIQDDNARRVGQVQGDIAATPVTRLRWQDLIDPAGANEDETQTSPNDRLMWDNVHDARYASALSPMMARRGRKRARSSSPISSPAADKPHTPVVNVEKLTKALRSPHADPTLALWDRYSLKDTEDTAARTGTANPALAQLMVSSSPAPLKASKAQHCPVDLRRTMSSGLNCPKRRKVERHKVGSQGSGDQRDLEAASKSSLVTALLDTVTSSLHDGSPCQRASQMATHSSSSKMNHMSTENGESARGKAKAHPSIPLATSSDYGDDDFDDDAFVELEATLTGALGIHSHDIPVFQSPQGDSRQLERHEPSGGDDFEELEDDILEEAQSLLNKGQASKMVHLGNGAAQTSSRTTIREDLEAGDDAEDEFGDDFGADIDLEAIELAATRAVQQSNRNPSTSRQSQRTIQRYLVINVLDAEYLDSSGRACPEKILLIQADGTTELRNVHLRGSWYDTPVHAESYAHVIGQFSVDGRCVVDDSQNLLILHPDQLLSSTVVADSFGCMRRAVLQDRVKATSEPTPPLVYGTILHEIFQEALLVNRWDVDFLSELISRTTEKHIEDLYTIKVGLAYAREHLQSKMTELSCWAQDFVASLPKPNAIVEDRHGKKANMAITKLLDVEEHVWSPMYGLKGNIDATVEVVMSDGQGERKLTVPFEVKTGKNANSSHMAQTALYTLLLSDRYDIDVAYGILYYMESSKIVRIPAVRHELRHLIMQRNELACHIRERSVQLPPMLRSKHMCGKCYAKTTCFVYHRLADDGDGETSGMHEKFNGLVKHLTPTHKDFFVKWENLLTREEKESQKTKRELWTMTSAQREKKSRCFSDVVVEKGSASVDADNPRINRFHYTFIKRIHPPGFSFLESELNVGEPVVVSDEEGHFALAIGYVTKVRKQRISVAVDRRLHNARIRQPGFDELDNQSFAGIMKVGSECPSGADSQNRSEQPVRYRLDQDEFSNGMATVRSNLVQMMANDVPQASRLRRLIVDVEAPRFKAVSTQSTIRDGECLNVDQKRAIEKVMTAQDYALVLGMPGTGKTFTIAHLIRALTSQGKSVLLTSHTHTAVDNILLKLKEDKIPILRLGAPAKIHTEVQDFATLAGRPMHSFDEIKEAWHGTPIVATTCLGINHPIFLERSFDYCIVDEASQITLPICAGPIRMARTFVLVGDHNQLPPVVRNEKAREGGLDVSLFKLLSDSHPEAVVNLAHQYRMCEDIMTLSNTLIYDGQLRCGTEALRLRKLHIPNMAALGQRHHDAATMVLAGTPRSICPEPTQSKCWLYDLIQGGARVRFVNTDTIEPRIREEAQGKRIVNAAEVDIVAQLVQGLLTVGVPDGEIGVMTHYRAQLFLLKDRLRPYAGVEMHTTDRFQGRDKEVILLSLVRSNDACNIGDLLRDWRRINVAFTRAKTKLLVVGSMSTLRGRDGNENMLGRFIALMEARSWIYDMPRDALRSHYFEEMSTQITSTTAAATQRIKSPRKEAMAGPRTNPTGKENMRPSPRRAKAGEKALLKGKIVTRDILNEMTNGAY